MTPYELNLYIHEFNEKSKRDEEEKLTIAYLTAYWHRVKRMPDLKQILQQEPKEQTPEDMLEEIKRLNAALGGTTY